MDQMPGWAVPVGGGVILGVAAVFAGRAVIDVFIDMWLALCDMFWEAIAAVRRALFAVCVVVTIWVACWALYVYVLPHDH